MMKSDLALICVLATCWGATSTDLLSQLPQAPSLTGIHQVSGVTPTTQLGTFVAIIDDMNGDGCDEFLVGERGSLSVPSTVVVASGLTGLPLVTLLSGAAMTGIGANGARLGDMDGDGRREFGVTTNTAGPLPAVAEARIYSGQTGGLLYAVAPFPGNQIHDIADLGDLDQDGAADFCVGIAGATVSGGNPLLGGGAVFVHSGANGGLMFQLNGLGANHGFGLRVSGLGDVNGDGFPDLGVFSAREPTQSIQTTNVYVYACQPAGATLLYQYVSPNVGSQGGTGLGSGLAAAGDLDGDGKDDFMFGSPGPPIATTIPSGPFIVYSGATGQPLWSILPPQAFLSQFGIQSALAGDMDGDGQDEIAIAAPFADLAGLVRVGVVYIYSTATRQLLFQVHGGTPLIGHFGISPLGQALDGGGDVNGDGLADIIVGQSFISVAHVFAGSPAMSPLCAAGTVGAAGGGMADVLSLASAISTPSSGGLGRTVVHPVGSSLSLWVARPPLHAGFLVPYAVFGRLGATPSLSVWALPFGLGWSCVLPSVLSPADPSLFLLANTFGGMAGVVPAVPAFAQLPGTPVSGLGVIGFPLTVVLQGVIEDSSAGPLPLRLTNALRLIVQ